MFKVQQEKPSDEHDLYDIELNTVRTVKTHCSCGGCHELIFRIAYTQTSILFNPPFLSTERRENFLLHVAALILLQ